MKNNGFCHLHTHNEFSLYDGFGKSIDMAKKVKELGQTSLALTNHGNVSGLIEHYYACEEVGVKPILGVETYFLPTLKNNGSNRKSFHLVLLVKNSKGYKNLMRLITKANEIGFYYRPRIDFKMLEEYGEGLIVSSACQTGIIPKLLKQRKHELALKVNKKFKGIFGEDYYLEVMPHSLGVQKETNKDIIGFAKETKTPIIMTLDSHYTNKNDFEVHKLLVGARRKDKKYDFRGYHEAFIAGEDEIQKMWKKNHPRLGPCSKYIKNTLEVANKCEFKINFKDLYPKLKLKQDSHYVLRKIVFRKLRERNKVSPKYAHRLRRELEVIKVKDFSDYFLICYDIMRFARKKKIISGFGRGSVAGSLVAYLLGITLVDPITRDTLFERFLRKDKTLVPDIDMDFEATRRDEIFEYIKNKFPNKTAQVVSYNTWRIRNTINELSKIYNCDDELKKILIEKIVDIFGEHPETISLKRLYKDKDIYKIEKMTSGMINNFKKIFGQVSHYGSHACGIAITNKPITNYLAIMKSCGKMVTSYDMHSLEKLGILKLDILGLNTMSIIGITQNLAGVKFKEEFLKDKKVIKGFRKSETDGIFQFENFGGKAILRKVRPNSFKEIIACNAMNRPAPLKTGVIKSYIKGKRGKVDKNSKTYKYCKETYGVPIYQEQVIKICRKMAKMEWNDIDLLTRDFREKGKEEDIKKKFVKGMVGYSGYSEVEAGRLFDRITLYAFNKSHAVAYSLVSFYSMWLLKYYPLEYIFALLSRVTNERKIRIYQTLAAKNGILVMLPHVNKTAYTSIGIFDGEKVIQLGLNNIKGIAGKSAEAIISKGPFNNEFLVRQRVPKRSLNSTMFQVLLEKGAMEFDDNLYINRVRRYNAALFASSLRREERENG